MSHPPIYLDYNATAPLLPAVAERMRAIEALPLNASSVHHYGRMAKKLVEDARRVLAERLSVWPDEVIFTASGTEANNMALNGLPGHRLLVAATEHSSVLKVAQAQEGSVVLPVLSNGLLNMEALEKALAAHQGEKLLVSVMLANNETGVIQPIREIAALAHRYGAKMHTDAVQAIGKLSFDFNLLGVDMMTLGAHKIGGPIGVGALVVRNDVQVLPLLLGGGQEKRRRAGTENVAAIAGFGWALEALPDMSVLAGYRQRIIAQCSDAVAGSRVAGDASACLPNTLNLTMPGVSSETQLIHFDLAGICVSAGSACSSGRIEPSHVLQAMGYSADEANSALRISMGWATTEMEVERFIAEWQKLHQRLGQKAAA